MPQMTDVETRRADRVMFGDSKVIHLASQLASQPLHTQTHIMNQRVRLFVVTVELWSEARDGIT